MADVAESGSNSEQQNTTTTTIVKFCPICGAELYQGVIYGFDAWICPEGDYFEFID